MGITFKRLVFLPIALLGLLLVTKQSYALTIDSSGNVTVTKAQGQVLSKGSDGGDNSSSGSGSSGSSSESGSSGPSGSASSGSSDDRSGGDKTETVTTGGTVVRTEVKDDEVRTETRFPSGIRVKTREEEGRTRVDVYQGGVKLRLERRDDRTIIKLENEAGEGVELPEGAEDEIFKIEERAGKEQIKVRAAGEEFLVLRDKIGATTNFPLSVNLATNELTVTTPAGEKVVAVLPDQAVRNMLAANVIDQVRGIPFTQDVEKIATQAGTTLQDVVRLTTTREGILVYEIPGVSNQRLLGFFNVPIARTAVVSTETGEALAVRESLLTRVVDLFSF
ncbi:MAG: hypothetical protein Q7S79_02855 [bacterium]|nr:hypothetical protein [bacterium]